MVRIAGCALMTAGLLVSPRPVVAQPPPPQPEQLPQPPQPPQRVFALLDAARAGDSFELFEQADREKEAARRDREREDSNYESGTRLLEKAQWQQAADRFATVAALRGSRVDAALYWKAYALDKLGQKAEALTTVGELIKGYPASRWMTDAKALEIQVRQSIGQPVRPEAEADEELKLYAIQGLQHSNPEQAIPMLEKILQSASSPRLKERALFVLAQSNSARARQAITAIAKGAGNPDLQRRAIQYLGTNGTAENRQVLAEIYGSSNDIDVKRRILRAFMVAGDRQRVLAAATGESAPELRSEAVRQLGVMGAHDELWQLYQKEGAVEVKKQILQAMFVGGNATRLIELANGEQNPELRRTAIRNLGLMSSRQTADALVGLYQKEKDVEIKKAVIQGLFVQSNAEQLVAIARKETDPAMKREMVSKLSVMRNKVATDYLLELLK
jgi:outer membrane protein assembly factor BamD (BamD/ComL family)